MSEVFFGAPLFLAATGAPHHFAEADAASATEAAMSRPFLRCIAALARRLGMRGGSPWLADCLREIERHQQRLARAAHCVVSGDGPDSLEDLLCSADRMQDRLAELCERTAVIATLRALAAQRERCRDPGAAA